MKPPMSSDSGRSAVTRTKAPLPLCEVWFTSQEAERVFEQRVAEETANGVHLLYPAIYFRGRVDGYLAADKNPSEHSYQVASGHTHTHRVIYSPADNKSLLAPLFSIQSRLDLKAAKRLGRLKLFTSHFLLIRCLPPVFRVLLVCFFTQPSSHLQAPELCK